MSSRLIVTLIFLTVTFFVTAGPLSAKFDPVAEFAPRESLSLTSEGVSEIGPLALENNGENWVCYYDPVSGRPLWSKVDPYGLYWGEGWLGKPIEAVVEIAGDVGQVFVIGHPKPAI